MAHAFGNGDAVQTPLGKGVVREVRNGARLLIEVHGQAVVMEAATVRALFPARRHRQARQEPQAPAPDSGRLVIEVDLHGLTVADALTRTDDALDDALRRNADGVRLIHGRSGGRIRSAVHARLRAIPSVRAFRIDPRNEGVTVVTL
jgi:dsDNA-specific endonuclease/ATPase MutS2